MKNTISSILIALGIALNFLPLAGAQYAVYRVGAICMDGTRSNATGSGACSYHGGVMCWLYSDGSCR